MATKATNIQTPDTYDIVIIGAGIAGFTAATELLRWRRGLRVALLDKYKFLGGRAFTYEADVSGVHYQWEEGGARISLRHTGIRALLRRYGLTEVPLTGPPGQFRPSGATAPEPDAFEAALPATLFPLRALPPQQLATNTLRKLLTTIHGPAQTSQFLDRHPYRAELDTMRADMALELFEHEFRTHTGYVLVKEGLSELIRRMEADFTRRGGTVLRQHEWVGFDGDAIRILQGRPSEGPSRPERRLTARHTIFALPSEALRKVEPFSSWPTLSHLTMCSLLRVYSVFPPGPDGRPWFADLPRIITASRPRYILPNNPANGSIQISYTDSTDADPLIAQNDAEGETALGRALVEDLRTLFGPDRPIPDPIFTKAHPWKEGVTYWLPGTYDPYALSREACHPFPREHPTWWVCGESFSTRQCWMEGAVEHTMMMLSQLKKRL